MSLRVRRGGREGWRFLKGGCACCCADAAAATATAATTRVCAIRWRMSIEHHRAGRDEQCVMMVFVSSPPPLPAAMTSSRLRTRGFGFDIAHPVGGGDLLHVGVEERILSRSLRCHESERTVGCHGERRNIQHAVDDNRKQPRPPISESRGYGRRSDSFAPKDNIYDQLRV